MATEVVFSAKDKISPVIDKAKDALETLLKTLNRLNTDLDKSEEVVFKSSQAFNELSESAERVSKVSKELVSTEEKSRQQRQESSSAAQKSAKSEKAVSEAKEESTKQTKELAKAEQNLNRQRTSAKGGTGGGVFFAGGSEEELDASLKQIRANVAERRKIGQELTKSIATEQKRREAIYRKGAEALGKSIQYSLSLEDRGRKAELESFKRTIIERSKIQESLGDAAQKNFANEEKIRREELASLRRSIEERYKLRKAESDAIGRNVRYNLGLEEKGRKQELESLKRTIIERNNLRQREEQENKRRLERQVKDTERAARLIEVGLLELFFTIHSIQKPISELTRFFEDLLRANISASAEVEKFSATLEVASGSSSVAAQTLEDLLHITAELAAIDTASLIQFSSRLQTAGLSAKQAQNAIVAVTKRMEEQGKGASQTVRVLEQFVQAINANAITMQDFRPILREYPTLYKDFSEALGANITDLDSFRTAAEEAGGATAAIVQGLNYIAGVAEGAKLDTINKQLDEFRDRIFVIQAALGDALRPAIVNILKFANRLLSTFEDMGIGMRTLISVFTVSVVAVGRFAQAILQLGIIGIVIVQMQAAIAQINAMSVSLNAATAAMTGTTAATAQLPGHITAVGKAMTIFRAVLPKLLAGLGVLVVLLHAIPFLYVKLREGTVRMQKAYENFISTLTALPDAIKNGDEAIKNHIRNLVEYRREIERTREELRQPFQDAYGDNARNTLDAGLVRLGLKRYPNQELKALADQAKVTQENIIDLGRAFDIDPTQFVEEIENASASLEDLNVSVIKSIVEIQRYAKSVEDTGGRIQSIINVLRRMETEFREAFTDGDVENARKLALAIQQLTRNFIEFHSAIGTDKSVENYEASLIKLDFAIRRLEDSIGRFDAEDFVDPFGNALSVDDVNKTFGTLRQNLRREAALNKTLAEQNARERGDSEQELSNKILQIKERLTYDLEILERRRLEFIENVAKEAAQIREDIAEKELKAAEERQKEQMKLEEELADFIALQNARLHRQKLEDARDTFEIRRTERDLILQGVANAALLDERVAAFYRNAKQGSVDFIELQDSIRNQLARSAESVEELTKSQIEANKVFEESPALQQRGEVEPRTPLQRVKSSTDADLDAIEELTNKSIKALREVESQNEQMVRRFSRGVSTSLTDLIYEGEFTFQSFLKEFAKTTTKIIIQSKLEAFILKQIDDDVTQHKINNLRSIAGARIRYAGAGASIEGLVPSVISGLSPAAGVAGLLTGGAGTVALIGLALAPLLVDAIKDGFSDTEVKIDGREAGKIVSNNIRRGIRSGEIRRF